MNYFFFKKKIEFDFYTILIFLTFYTYTFYGIISKNYNFLFTVLSLFLFTFFYFFYKKKKFSLVLNINLIKLLIFFAILIISIILNYNDLFKPLHGDEYANALRTQRTAIFTIYKLLDNTNLTSLKELNFNYLIHIFSFAELIFIILILFLVKKNKNIYTLLFLFILTILFRYFLKDYGMHPPLNHLSSFIFTSVFGFKEFIFRFSYIFVYALGNFLLYLQLKKYLGSNLSSIIFVLFTLTIPICILSSSNIDHSVWSFIFLLNFLIYYYFEEKINYKNVVLLICLFSMARITIFILILPILFEYIYKKKNNFNLKDLLITFAPILFFFPFIIKTLILGSNVHNEKVSNLLHFIINNILKFDYIHVSSFFIQFHIIFLFFLGILFVFKNKKKYFKNLNLFFTFLIYFIVYNSIEEKFIGHPKYIFEFIVPFILLIIMQIFINFKKISQLILLALIFINFYNYNKIDSKIYINENSNKQFQIKKRYNYDLAFQEIKNKNLKLSNHFIGVYYGFVTEIFYNYNFKELKKVRTKNLMMKQKLVKVSNYDDLIFTKSNINSLMIIDDNFNYNKEKFENWKKVNEFYFSNRSSNKIIHLIK